MTHRDTTADAVHFELIDRNTKRIRAACTPHLDLRAFPSTTDPERVTCPACRRTVERLDRERAGQPPRTFTSQLRTIRE